MALPNGWYSEQLIDDLSNAIDDALGSIMANQSARDVMEWVSAPGVLLLSHLGVDVVPGWSLLAALLLGWIFWVRVSRFLFFSFARPLGLAGAAEYRAWLRLGLPWQRPFRALLEVPRFFRQIGFAKGPSGHWASFWEIASNPFDARAGGILVGRLALFQRLGLHLPVGLPDGGKHVACLSYAGGGKTSWLQTWLGCLNPRASAFVFDMDGAMVNSFGAVLEREGHKVIKLDPDNLAKGFPAGARWNPMNELTIAAKREGAGAVVAFAEALSKALIVEDSKTQPVFAQTARVILKALILYVWLVEKDKSLVRVRELLTQGLPEKIEAKGETAFGRLVFEMSVLGLPHEDGTRFDDGCDGAICEAIANCCGLMQGGQGSATDSPDHFRKTAIYQTHWIDDPNIARVISGESDICGEDLKLSNPVVFIVATLTDTQTRLAPLTRAFILLTLYAFERTRPDMTLKYPCAFFLDEFPNLGRMEVVALAAPGFRKFGVRLITISQSIGLLRRTYPDEYKEFLNQAECVVWMGISQTDTETLTYLSRDVLGEHMRKEKIDGYHWLARGFFRVFGLKLPPARYQRVARRLMTEQQCAAFLDRSTKQIIVTREGRAPMRMKKLVYWEDLPVWKYAIHKGHGEALPRQFTRRLLRPFITQRGVSA